MERFDERLVAKQSPIWIVVRLGRSYYYYIMKTLLSKTREDNSMNDPNPNFNVVREGRSIWYQYKYFILPIIFNSWALLNGHSFNTSSSIQPQPVSKILNLGLCERVNDLSFRNDPAPT